MNKPIPFDEQETVIIMYPPQVSKAAEVYSCMPNMLKKLRKLAETRPDCVRIKQDLGDAIFVDMDRSCVKISPKRKLTEEQRAAASERLAKGRAIKNDSQ